MGMKLEMLYCDYGIKILTKSRNTYNLEAITRE